MTLVLTTNFCMASTQDECVLFIPRFFGMRSISGKERKKTVFWEEKVVEEEIVQDEEDIDIDIDEEKVVEEETVQDEEDFDIDIDEEMCSFQELWEEIDSLVDEQDMFVDNEEQSSSADLWDDVFVSKTKLVQEDLDELLEEKNAILQLLTQEI